MPHGKRYQSLRSDTFEADIILHLPQTYPAQHEPLATCGKLIKMKVNLHFRCLVSLASLEVISGYTRLVASTLEREGNVSVIAERNLPGRAALRD